MRTFYVCIFCILLFAPVLAIKTNQYFGSGGDITNTTNYNVSYGLSQIFIGNLTDNTSALVGIYYIGSINTSNATFCGDVVCNGAETCGTCPGDCGACQVCGDLTCNGTETWITCPGDCPPACPDGVCNGVEDCALCPVDCGACPPSGGGGGGGISGDTGLDSYYANITANITEQVYSTFCPQDATFIQRLTSQCIIPNNNNCDDGEYLLFHSDCRTSLAMFADGEVFQQMWFLRYFLILSIFLLFKDSKKYPLVVATTLVLFIFNHAFVRPGYVLDEMQCLDVNFFINAGYCIMPTYPMFGWVIMLSIIALFITYIFYFKDRKKKITKKKKEVKK